MVDVFLVPVAKKLLWYVQEHMNTTILNKENKNSFDHELKAISIHYFYTF